MTSLLRWLLTALFVFAFSVACGFMTHLLLQNTVQATEPYANALLSFLRLPTPSRDSVLLGIACSIVLCILMAARLIIRWWSALWKLKRVWFSAIFLLSFVIFTAYLGLFQSREGRDLVITVAAKIRADLLQSRNPHSHMWSSMLHFVAEFPLLIIACKFDYICLNRILHKELGPVFPTKNGIAIASHHGVKAVMTSSNQPRGHYIGANVAPDACMLPDTLIFTSTGQAHSRIRKLLLQAIPAFTSSSPPPVHPSAAAASLVLRRRARARAVSLEQGASATTEETSLSANEGASEDNLDPPYLDNVDPPPYVRASKDDVRRCSVASIRIRDTHFIVLITLSQPQSFTTTTTITMLININLS